MSELLTNKYMSMLEDDTAMPDDEHNPVFVCVVEHYEIIDPNLPYEKRFRTDHYTVTVNDELGTFRLEQRCEPEDLLGLAIMFANAARDAFTNARRARKGTS